MLLLDLWGIPSWSARALGNTEYCSCEESYCNLVRLHHANLRLKHLVTCLNSLSFWLNLCLVLFTVAIVRSLRRLTGASVELGRTSMRYETYSWKACTPISRNVSMSLACSGDAFCPLNTLTRPRLDCTFDGIKLWAAISEHICRIFSSVWWALVVVSTIVLTSEVRCLNFSGKSCLTRFL